LLVFNDVAKHDIVWGELKVDFDTDICSSTIQHLLTLGLEKVHLLLTCKTYTDREKALRFDEMPPAENEEFWAAAFMDAEVEENNGGDAIL
jgi:hypothetical protein